MPFDPENPYDLSRLRESMRYSRRKLRPFREKRLDALRQYVGHHYSDEGTAGPVPVNLIALQVDILCQYLVARDPRFLITTKYRKLKAASLDLEAVVNHRVGQMRLRDTLREAVRESMFSVGVVKVGRMLLSGVVSDPDFGELNIYDEGAESVSFDDFCFDCSARKWGQCQYMGDRYRMPLEEARSNPRFNASRENLAASTRTAARGEEGGVSDELSFGQTGEGDEYDDKVDCWDIYLPSEQLIVTVPNDQEDIVLAAVKWEGPEAGPYHILSYYEVPGNLMPLPPVAAAMDLHLLSNELYRKCARQARREKEVGTATGASADDAKRAVEAVDGEFKYFNHPGGLGTIRFGGLQQPTLGFGMHTTDIFKTFTGNLDQLGGLGSQAGTLGQEEMLQASASRRVGEMQSRVVSFTRDIGRDLSWYHFYDPLADDEVPRQVSGTDRSVVARFNQDVRAGEFLDYNFDIVPYSMEPKSPAMRLQVVQSFMQSIGPFLPLMQQQGIGIDFEGYARTVARYADMPELDEILTFTPTGREPQPKGNAPMQAGAKPAATTRTNVRVSRSAGSGMNDSQRMMQAMLSAPQPSQSAAG
jgi:hypothetical protein